MSLVDLGCNPNHKWTIDSAGTVEGDVRGAQPVGTLARSPDGGLYVAIRAGEVIAQYAACLIDGGWSIREFDAADDDDDNASVCLPQIALASGEYGWGLVWGNGRGVAAAAITTGAPLYPSNTEGRVDDAANANIVFTGLYSAAAQGTAGSPVAVTATFPKAVAVG